MAPRRFSLKKIEDIIHIRAGWIKRKIEEITSRRTPTLANGTEIYFQGKPCRIEISQAPSHRGKCEAHDDIMEIFLPNCDLQPKELSDEIRTEITLWCKKQARTVFRQRLELFGEKLGVAFGKSFVTSPSRRWGSCNSKNDIRLNWRLIMTEPELLDYVAAHELCHIVHKNHSRAFWNLLGTVMPDYKHRRQRLREWEKSGKLDF